MKRLLYGTIIPILLLLLATALSIAHIISNSVFLYIFMAAVVMSVFGQRMTRDAGRRLRPWPSHPLCEWRMEVLS